MSALRETASIQLHPKRLDSSEKQKLIYMRPSRMLFIAGVLLFFFAGCEEGTE